VHVQVGFEHLEAGQHGGVAGAVPRRAGPDLTFQPDHGGRRHDVGTVQVTVFHRGGHPPHGQAQGAPVDDHDEGVAAVHGVVGVREPDRGQGQRDTEGE
jgi:hypothetical protein